MRSGYCKADGFLGFAGLLLFVVSSRLTFLLLQALGRKAYDAGMPEGLVRFLERGLGTEQFASALRSAMGAPATVDLET